MSSLRQQSASSAVLFSIIGANPQPQVVDTRLCWLQQSSNASRRFKTTLQFIVALQVP
jgi:hypothetical protein